MATLVGNGSNQYCEFSTLGGGLDAVSNAAHTIVLLLKRGTTAGFQESCTLVNSGRSTTYDSLGCTGTQQLADLTRSTVLGGSVMSSTTVWYMYAITIDTADTPDAIFHHRDHTANAAWTHTNSGQSPAYGGASTPGATGFVQLFRWQTTDYWNGSIALAAIWNARLTNTQFDELKANDKTSDWWNCTAGQPLLLVECNVAESSLTNIGAGSASRVAAANAPTLTGGDPDRWTFDGRGTVASIPSLVMAPPIPA